MVVVIQDKKDPEVCWLLQWCSTPPYFVLSFDFSHDCLPHFTVEISYLTKNNIIKTQASSCGLQFSIFKTSPLVAVAAEVRCHAVKSPVCAVRRRPLLHSGILLLNA